MEIHLKNIFLCCLFVVIVLFSQGCADTTSDGSDTPSKHYVTFHIINPTGGGATVAQVKLTRNSDAHITYASCSVPPGSTINVKAEVLSSSNHDVEINNGGAVYAIWNAYPLTINTTYSIMPKYSGVSTLETTSRSTGNWW